MQTRDVYNLGAPQSLDQLVRSLNFLLARIGDRLDRMEGLRGNPRFYTTKLEFPGGLTLGQLLQATAEGTAEFTAFNATLITAGVLAHERGGLELDVSAFSGLVKIAAGATSQVTLTALAESLLAAATAAAMRTLLGIPAWGSMALQGADNVAITGGTMDGVAVSGGSITAALVSIQDESETVIHQFPVELLAACSDTMGFY